MKMVSNFERVLCAAVIGVTGCSSYPQTEAELHRIAARDCYRRYQVEDEKAQKYINAAAELISERFSESPTRK